MELETNYLLAYAKCRQKVAYLERHLETLVKSHDAGQRTGDCAADDLPPTPLQVHPMKRYQR